MATLYLETSAFLAWLLNEPKSAEVATAIDGAATIVTSTLLILEVERALIRVERDGVLTEGQVQRLRGQCRKLGQGWTRMALSAEVLERAARAFPVEPVRALDALHLASALAFTRAFPDLTVLSFDDRMRDNAIALGIA